MLLLGICPRIFNHILMNRLNTRKSLREKSRVSKNKPRDVSNEDEFENIILNPRFHTAKATADSDSSTEIDNVSSNPLVLGKFLKPPT